MYDAVIFDLDGTLIDSESVGIAAGMQAFGANGYDVGPDLLHRLVGIDNASGAALLREWLGADLPLDQITRDWRAAARLRFETTGVPLRPGAADLLDLLAGRGFALAVATSSRREAAQWKLARAGLRHHFATVVSVDCITRPKPAPDPFLEAARRLGTAPARCVAFEDSETGAASAQAAGMTVVQVPDQVPTEGRHATLVATDLMSGARTLGLI